MYRFTNLKNWLFPFLMLNTLTVFSITFDTSVLKDTSQTNYTGFTNKNTQRNDKYKKLIADFNGDGFNDIVSLGGTVPCSLCSPSPPPVPIEIMLYKNGQYVYHEITQIFSNNLNSDGEAKAFDIDQDGDQDIVLSNGNIAINDGAANFTVIQFSNQNITGEFYLFDYDGDGSIDIISRNNIFTRNHDIRHINLYR